MKTEDPRTIHAEDYQPPAYTISAAHLTFDLSPKKTTVRSHLVIERTGGISAGQQLRLDGEKLKLLGIKLNGTELDRKSYTLDDTGLTLAQPPQEFTLDIETEIDPSSNAALEGLYLSNGMFCTQCEAQGFRRIAYFLDQPDIMVLFTTRIIADKDSAPVLLSNGNLINHGDLPDNRHFVEWHDPHPKPSYLFALVGGALQQIEDHFTTMSGRDVTLRIFVERGDEDRCGYAMHALKRAMRWDEETYGREYDLDIFMIVAVSHFNMGAMENKGLNIFNSQYILADPKTATDTDYARIESIIAHEYFHNWTGNRITCRDWFQLCLKEGLTVFRDQQFSSDMRVPSLQRISDVRALRARQFAEDSGPLAHPVRPDSYIEINNFYTATVYEKGAEIVRMLHTILGADGFGKGMDLYFDRYDGRAATVENFLSAFEEANQTDLTQFRLWYSQAGTPEIRIEQEYSPENGCFALTITQHTAPTPGQGKKLPLHIPLRIGLMNRNGDNLPLRPEVEGPDITGDILHLRRNKQTFKFHLKQRPILSALRNFSAPVRINSDQSREERIFLMGHDSDPFNRWEAGQAYASELMLEHMTAYQTGKSIAVNTDYIDALRQTVTDSMLDPFLVAETLHLPSEHDIGLEMDILDPDAIHHVRTALLQKIAEALEDDLTIAYHNNKVTSPYSPDPEPAGRRALSNRALVLLAVRNTPQSRVMALEHFNVASNMTDTMAALAALNNFDSPERHEAFDAFFKRWSNDPLVLNKWFSLQATSVRANSIAHVRDLLGHPLFSLENPNRVRALVGAFSQGNQICFHDPSRAGYDILADVVAELDLSNPQLAARLLSVFEITRKLDTARQQHIEQHVRKIAQSPKCSRNTSEIASKILEW